MQRCSWVVCLVSLFCLQVGLQHLCMALDYFLSRRCSESERLWLRYSYYEEVSMRILGDRRPTHHIPGICLNICFPDQTQLPLIVDRAVIAHFPN
jgi:hypothetical protein